MTDKEQQIRVEILPQLESLANQLWDDGQSPDGRRLDKILDELRNILNNEND
jgi:hypothetical protein